MKYRAGYKNQLVEDEITVISFYPSIDIHTHFIDFVKSPDIIDSPVGILTIRADYAWDGPSGPTIDTENFITPSLIHDALYQLMREGHLDPIEYKEPADKLLVKMCKDRGMNPIRRWWTYRGVFRFGGGSTVPGGGKPVITVP